MSKTKPISQPALDLLMEIASGRQAWCINRLFIPPYIPGGKTFEWRGGKKIDAALIAEVGRAKLLSIGESRPRRGEKLTERYPLLLTAAGRAAIGTPPPDLTP